MSLAQVLTELRQSPSEGQVRAAIEILSPTDQQRLLHSLGTELDRFRETRSVEALIAFAESAILTVLDNAEPSYRDAVRQAQDRGGKPSDVPLEELVAQLRARRS